MKKYLISFFLVIAFAFYIILSNQNSADIGPGANAPALNVAPQGTAGSSAPAQPAPSPVQTQGAASETPAPAGQSAPSANQTPASGGTPSMAPMMQPMMGMYKDGSYTGPVADAYYGLMQVRAVITGGKLSDVKILQYPSDRSYSQEVNSYALPQLVQEAIQAQNANVDIVSGATQSSEAFQQSLSSALARAKA